jgi:hypothetical protein
MMPASALDLLKTNAGRVDPEKPGDDRAKERGPDKDVQQRLGSDIDEQDRK